MARKCLQILLWWILVGITFVKAQRYPVTATVLAQPPFMPQLEYFTSEHFKVLLLLNDAQAGSVQVRLRFTIEGNGVRLQTSQNFIPAPIELNYGLPLQLTGPELMTYLDPVHLLMQGVTLGDYQQAGKLPEGFYSVCVEVYDYRRHETPISNQGCAYPYLEELEPPVITAPQQSVLATEPQQVLFSWLPQHLGVFPVMYTLYIYEWTKGLSLDQVWASQAPLTVESVTTSFLWGPGEVPLDTGKIYVARVRIEDVLGEAVFKNNGYSAERTFQIVGWTPPQDDCTPPEGLTAWMNGDATQLSWNGSADTFRISYWEDMAESSHQWLLTQDQPAMIPYLERGKSYRVMLSGYCNNGWQNGVDTLLLMVPAPKDTQVTCGEEVPVFGNQDPLLQLLPGDVVSAGGMPIEIVTATGSNGSFSGTGAFRLKYAPMVRLGIDFSGVRINTDYQLIEGQMQTHYDPAWSNIPSVNLDFSRQPRELAYRELIIPEDVDSVWVDETGRVWIVDNTGQEREVTQVDGGGDEPPVPVLIIDINGDVWRIIDGVVLEEGQDGVQTVLEQGNTDNNGKEILTGVDEALVTFQEVPDQDYGFDAIHLEKLSQFYEKLGGNYYVAYKSIAGARQDKVLAAVTNTGGISLDSVVFEAESGSRWPPLTWVQNSANLPVVGKGDGYEEAIYALLKNGKDYQSIGKLNTVSYEPVHHRVILVSVGQKQEVDALGIQDYLNEVYKQAVASWTVEVDEEVLQVDWDPEGDGLYIDRGVIDKYHKELDRIIAAYQEQRGIDQDSYYAFLIPKMQDPTILGFMPRGGSFAFIASGSDIARTLAHELGHGAFALEHIFADDATLEGQTDNLMDYSDGQHLMKHQWDRVHDPKMVWGLFEGEEEGKLILGSAFYYDHYVYFQHDRGEDFYATIAPDGTRIVLPENAIASFFPTDGGEWPKGCLTGFILDGKTYLGWWVPDEKRFLGYSVAIRDDQSGLLTHEKEFYKNDNYAPYTYRGYAVEGCDQIIEWDLKKEDGIPWTIYEKGTGVIGPCGCYFGPCSDLLIEYRNHPYLDPGTALSKVVCRNPCLLKDMYEYQYFVPQYSQWMEEVNKMFMGMLAIGMAPLAAATAVEIIPMAVPFLETIVTNNVRTKGTEFVTGFCIDIALNGAIEYYFLDNPHPFNNIDLAQATASGLEAMIDTKNKIYEVIGAAALSCLTDGFTEDGKIRDEFEVVECGKGILSSVITDIALIGGSKALKRLGNIPKGKLIKGLFKIFPSSSYGTATAGGGGPPNLVWTVFKRLHNGELDADAVKAFFDITDDDIAQRIVISLADQQVLDDLMGSGFYNFLRNLDWPESVKADLVDDLARDKVFRDAIAGSDALVKAWETLIAHPLIRKDIATLKSINKILDNAGIANIISKEDLQMSVKKLAEKGVKCRTCLSGNPAYRYLDEILDDLEHGATKFRDNYTSVITGFKQGGNFTEGAIFVADAVKRYGNDFPSGTLFEFTEVTTGGVRRVDVRVNNGFNGNKDVFFEFKSVQDVPPSGFATQFIKDMDLPDVSDLGQLKWWFDGKKVSNLPKQGFIDALENSLISQDIINKFVKSGPKTKEALIDLIDYDFDLIFYVK